MTHVKSYGQMAKEVARATALHGGVGALIGGGMGAVTSPDDRWGGARKGALIGGGAGAMTGVAISALPLLLGHGLRRDVIDTEAAYNAASSHYDKIWDQATKSPYPHVSQVHEEAMDARQQAADAYERAKRKYEGSSGYYTYSLANDIDDAMVTSMPAAIAGGAVAGSLHNRNKLRGEIAQLKANQPDASVQESADTPIKQAYLMATGDSSFDQEKMAGWLTDTISKAKGYITPSAVGKVVSPASGALKATGTMKQLQAGRNFGGATVDPFVKMRKSMMSPVGAAA